MSNSDYIVSGKIILNILTIEFIVLYLLVLT